MSAIPSQSANEPIRRSLIGRVGRLMLSGPIGGPVGKAGKLTDEERARIASAVKTTEKQTGMQVLVYLGKAKGDLRHVARHLLVEQGYTTVPGVVVLISPSQRKVEVATSQQASSRLSDEACLRAIEIMLPAFRRTDWIAGVELGLAAITEEAGPGSSTGEDLPDVLE